MNVRRTNLGLFVALALALATGTGAVATGSARGRWIILAHGVAAVAVVLLIPWKTRIVRYGLRPARPRRADLSRRTALRAAGLAAVAAALYATVDLTVRLAGLPGARRRFTGSYEQGSFQAAAMPATIWLDDSVPEVDPQQWRLSLVDGTGRYELTPAQLSASGATLRATLDCTSGWYAEQDWTGVPVSSVLRDRRGARSLYVHSITGYAIRFPVEEVDRLFLATGAGGVPLSAGHGYPLRLVAPDRRGYWWVKWVDRIELRPEPPWWQPPFPIT